jgi:thymidylate synthase
MSNRLDEQYKARLREVIEKGYNSIDRTGTGTRHILGLVPIRVDMGDGFPCSTLRKLGFKNQVKELLWFLSGSNRLEDLDESVHRWWEPFSYSDGDYGRSYGIQLRKAPRIDEYGLPIEYDALTNLIKQIKANPQSRRLCGSTWDSYDMGYASLPCCHGSMIQFGVRGEYLDLTTFNRSQDLILGTSHNLILYGLLLHIICSLTNYKPGIYVHQFGHAHIYNNHIEEAKRLIELDSPPLPLLAIGEIYSIDSLSIDDFSLIGYFPNNGKWDFKMSV